MLWSLLVVYCNLGYFWNFLLNLDTRHLILGLFLVNFEICQFLVTQALRVPEPPVQSTVTELIKCSQTNISADTEQLAIWRPQQWFDIVHLSNFPKMGALKKSCILFAFYLTKSCREKHNVPATLDSRKRWSFFSPKETDNVSLMISPSFWL